MKKVLFIICFLSSNILFAQFGQITNIQIIPANPTEADQVKVVVEAMLGSSPCTLDNAVSNINGNTIELSNYYCGGMLQTICSRTDTINLGNLAAGLYNLAVNMAVGCGPYTPVDSALSNGFTVSVFSGLNAINKVEKFSIYPNPTHNSEVQIQAISSEVYQLVCLNALGQEIFATSNLTGNQIIYLPQESGIYFIKIIDAQNQICVLKCHRN